MILVDTSVWIDYFRDRPTRQVDRFVQLLVEGTPLLGDLILTELLQGCDTDREFAQVKFALDNLQLIEICGATVALQAAQNYRTLRRRGITVRKTIDTLIATRCIVDNIPLLYSDRDFDPFVEHLGLIPCPAK
jgi:predicted nucleic acid-binding protein